MSQAIELLDTLKSIGVTVRVIPPDTLRLEPASKIPADLLAHIRQSKPEILAALARCAHCEGKGECYCPACTLRRTEKPVPCCMCRRADRQVWLAATRPETCWNCGGSGRCEDIGCNPKEPCRTCGGSGKAPAWIQ